MCRILEISRASYYKWINRKESEKNRLDQELCQIILEYHVEYKGILGYRRMTMFINRFCQTNYNVKRIRRLMRLMGISSVIRRKRKGYLRSKPQITAENGLNREFTAKAPNTKWLTDVSEFKVIGSNKKVFLSAIIDLYDTSVVAYKLGYSNNNILVFKTFNEALAKNPTAKPLFHSDKGFQYTTKTMKNKIDNIDGIQSMSRVGRCIDNGPMEGFFGTIKSEMYYLQKFDSHEELRREINKYINFYNNKRFQRN